MSTQATVRQIDEILARHGIKGPQRERINPPGPGGRIAQIFVAGSHDEVTMTVVIGETSASALLPLEFEAAEMVVERFRGSGLPATDMRFEHLLANLLFKISKMFFDSGAVRLRFDEVHLHESGYSIGSVKLETASPLHVAARLEPHAHDRKAQFSHRHGSRLGFPK